VANDSGVMHLGAALGLPIAALFGPTDERLTAPRTASVHAVLTHSVWCRPCMLRECPLDHRCMRGIAVSEVASATRRMM
jgi:heptosyltransferase-2